MSAPAQARSPGPTTRADPSVLGVLDLAAQATVAHDRPDLGRRLAQVRERVSDPHVRVLVVGEFKQGKSSLVNGLVGAAVCPVDDDVATSVPTAVGYADEPEAVALHAPTDEGGGQPRREEIPVEDIADYVSEAGNPANERRLWALEVGINRELLRGGLVLVDTPGVGGLGSAHSATTIGALPSADAVILCSDASQEYTEPELAFLDMARELCPNIICVLTKTDFYPEWRKIADLDRQHLADRGISAPVLPTSAKLRERALATQDQAVNAESGYAQLVTTLRQGVVGDAARLTRRSVGQAATAVADQLARRFRAERTALTDPAARADVVAELERAKERARALRGRAARWQQTLSDGFADLSADADHDLRGRTRRVMKGVETGLESVDPGEVWEQLEQWLYRTVTEEVAAHYTTVNARARDLAAEVAEHFANAQGEAAIEVDVRAPLEMLRQIDPVDDVEADERGIGAKGLTAMRSGYGGVLMIGMLSGFAGLAMINPLSLGFGVLLGRKALKEEGERTLTQRKAQARQACRGYLDEVSFVVGKDARDTLRRLQRTLRDTFTARAEELQQSTGEALEAAQNAVRLDEGQRATRLAEIEAELAGLADLRGRGVALFGERPAAVHARGRS